MSYRKIIYERQGDVAVITLDEPQTLNAVGAEMVHELADALTLAETTARAVLLTGAGRGFCSGANLSSDFDVDAADWDAGADLERLGNPLVRQLRGLTIPLVTAVNGPAAGIGCSIALSGDIILGAESAYFLLAFRHVGLVPDGGLSFMLARSVGRVRAMEMMMLGERLTARSAFEWGLITRLVPDDQLRDAALGIASGLAAGPTKALSLIRRIGWAAAEGDFEAQLQLERASQREASGTQDHREGVKAFLAKRKPRFEGS
jgi:2-(1,2-epoxy-1,2-dihydrophenyl)acetyl-CoA isomerase